VVTRRAGSTASATLLKLFALLLALGLVAAACGGGGDDGGDDGGTATGETDDGGSGDEGDGEGEGGGTTPTTEPRDEGEPVEGGSITVGLEAESNGWRPGTASWASSGYNVAYTVYDPLMARTAEGEVEPYMAESLEANEDFTEFTLTLRPDVTFHDGTPLDAEAIKSNFDNFLKAPASNLGGVLKNVTAFEVIDELTGKYVLEEGNAAFPDLLVTAVGMPFSPTAAEEMGEEFNNAPVGTGPYKFVSWQRDAEFVVERYEDYWGTPGYLDEITFRPIPDEDTRLQSVLSGDIEAFTTLRQSIVTQALEAEEQGSIETTLSLGNNGGGAIYNTLIPPVDDPRVRLGLAHALNQDDLVAILGGEGITPVRTQYFEENSPWYSEAVAEAWPAYDPDKSQELLDEYMNDPERSDGKSPGDPIAVQFNCPPDPSLLELSQAYQSFWSEVGVEVELKSVEQAAHIGNAIGSGATDPPFSGEEYMINCWRMGGEGDPYTTLSIAFGEVATQPLNFTNYQSDTVDEQLEILRTSADDAERAAAVEAIGLEFAEQVPNLWTGGTAVVIGNVPEVNGVGQWTLTDGTLGSGIADAITRWGQVWIEQ